MSSPFIIFCADPLDPRAVEPTFSGEVEPAKSAGFTIAKLDHDELDRHVNPVRALKTVRFDGMGKAVYRGWMVGVDAYSALFTTLGERDISLITTPEQYAACHHTPGSYTALAEWMPPTTWIEIDKLGSIDWKHDTVAQFGNSPIVIKDWVKSQASGYWNEACYIQNASDHYQVDRVIDRFRELQGDSLVGGIVFKAYIPLLPVGEPAYEYRAFIVNGTVAGCWPRSEAAQVLGSPPYDMLANIARNVPSPFASADFGKDIEGRWWLLEVGDGQVSGLPSPDAASAIFSALAQS